MTRSSSSGGLAQGSGLRAQARPSRPWLGTALSAAAIAAFAAQLSLGPDLSAQTGASRGLTAVPGLKVGHHTLTERPTGCTVVLAEKGATAGVDVRGSAPGTRETDLLAPTASVEQVHGIVLSGGSAYGLDAASGVMRYLEQQGVGFKFGGAVIPIVPGAILFDLGVGDPRIRPTAECGYLAAKAATDGPVAEGNVGAGAGATVGKMGGRDRAMKAGIGSAAITLPNGLIVAALVAVNARGDVIDPSTGQVVAGMRTEDGKGLADVRRRLKSGALDLPLRFDLPLREALQHTTLGIVATNATLTKTQATRIAQMAHDGLARAISPAHTSADGDAIFALATGVRTGPDDLDTIGTLAAEAMAEAIVRAVRAATGIPGYPAARDLR
jgi:L-aminopeptidase/D-esterase-like protein